MIKPRLGSHIEFNSWALFGSAPPQGKCFTGTLVGKEIVGKEVIYMVARDYDGEKQTVLRENLVGYAPKTKEARAS